MSICIHCRQPMAARESRKCIDVGDADRKCVAGHGSTQATHEADLRAANEEVVQALRERRRIGKLSSDDSVDAYKAAGVRLDDAMDALDALHSPSQLPSSQELQQAGNVFNVRTAYSRVWELSGAYWLRWLAERHTAGGKHPSKEELCDWADELRDRT